MFPEVGMKPGKFPKGMAREGTGHPDVPLHIPRAKTGTKSTNGSLFIDVCFEVILFSRSL